MRLSTLLTSVSSVLFLPTILSLLWLYSYPAAKQCSFPLPPSDGSTRSHAPFRLLALADPQLEGDTSLPDPDEPLFPSLLHLRQSIKIEGQQALRTAWPHLRHAAVVDLPRVLQGYRKRLDLLGNDYYLAHIYRSMRWWTQPAHVVVLGDLLGSQWIDEGEFQARARRFWNRVFTGAALVPIETTAISAKIEVLGEDKEWSNRIMAVAGNHDIGYAGDIVENRVARFEKAFGRVNWETRLVLGKNGSESLETLVQKRSPELRLMVLNTMNIDEPVKDTQLRDETLLFLGQSFTNAAQRNNQREATVVLTHIPLHKEAGICVDGPYFSYFSSEQGMGIREQNHLRSETSQRLLSGFGSRAIILNGHDHEGCDTIHTKSESTADGVSHSTWVAERFTADKAATGTREITVRSMMGSYGGNAGLLSGWYDYQIDAWQFEYSTCSVGVQHIWWAIHVLAIVQVLITTSGLTITVMERLVYGQRPKQKRE